MLRTILFLPVCVLALLAQPAPPENGPGVGQNIRQNLQALKQYTHKRRMRVEVKDQVRSTRLDLVRYVNGQMETVPLEAPPRPPQQPSGPLRRHMVEKKREEMKEYAERLTSLLHRYLMPDPENLSALLSKAAISRPGPGPDADTRIVITGMVKPSDSFTLVWNQAWHHPVRTEVRTDLDGDPVQITLDYAVLPEGPSYPAHVVVWSKKRDIRITVENFEYTRS